MKPRDAYRYVLRDGRRIVQYGISNDPEARANEHAGGRKRFTGMTVVGPAVTRDSALDWERSMIEAYRRSHGGRNPRYNKV
jgi:predicted GIY-YIG superfamily endonuclease